MRIRMNRLQDPQSERCKLCTLFQVERESGSCLVPLMPLPLVSKNDRLRGFELLVGKVSVPDEFCWGVPRPCR